jgi:hypothetical protein
MPSISFNISDENYVDFENAFLKENPVPLESSLTPIEWIEEWGKQQYLNAVKRGKIKLAQEGVVVDPNIISCSLTS